MMLTAIPRHWFSWNFTLLDGGLPFGELGMAMWREKGGFTISNTVYRISRERLFSGGFVLESNGVVIATARKPKCSIYPPALTEQGGAIRAQAPINVLAWVSAARGRPGSWHPAPPTDSSVGAAEHRSTREYSNAHEGLFDLADGADVEAGS
ncbi:MAG: hypothetical protein IPI83_14220 [Sphingomonadales bacterium]|nr:hypothetical protein [Sphingomonadales bacterium]